MRQFTRPSPRVKPTRRTSYPDTPFGFGLTARVAPVVRVFGFVPPSPEDEMWWARESGGGHPTELVAQERMTDRDYDRMAEEAMWADAYESGLMANDRCLACGTTHGPFTLGYCDGCSVVLERDGEFEGGRCSDCGRTVDYLEPSGLCCPCDLRASDMATGSNGGR